ncbi:2,5-diketo-D-gluconate reductase B [Candidatus Nanohalobium constans]|uniref:2,5-diketo-D-gluconate reductase B n=1 Tax=Candidatus Nanohalobium constans TaxID=2565781 RepID=A0A5Q0UGJ6_9ARCH|nr:aldo/keto reductase [Candidatus Nanohalobium constans]QGA80501.1 2,5-diketo-D-gluconate reductase B [Candidatus Nanohalobium constans]
MSSIPKLGLGTWQNTESDECAKSVQTALEIGYKHIDTAQVYENEEHVGKGIKEADIDRDDFFLASKVWIDQLSEENVVPSMEESLEKLGVDKVDLMYIHWPSGDYQPEETLEAMQELVEKGMAKNIGVSNFTPEQVDEAMGIAGEDIIANQVEMHPLLQQEELLEKCREHDITLVAYSPLARGKVFDIPELNEIADKHGVSEAQVSLAWLMQKDGVVAIPKASSEEHIRDNHEAQDLELDEEDVEKIESIDREEREVDPGFAPW